VSTDDDIIVHAIPGNTSSARRYTALLPVAALWLERVDLRRGEFFERLGDGWFMRRHEWSGWRRSGAVREPGGCA